MLSHTYSRRVEWGDCDPAGIIYNPVFFHYFNSGTVYLLEAAGWDKARMLAEFGAVGTPLVETGATFHAPCAYDETVDITSTVTRVGRSSFGVRHEMRRGDLLCASGQETRVWTVRQADGTLKSAPLPQAVAASLGS